LDFDARPWAQLDGPSLASSAAALQLLPENIPCLLRAQLLAAIGAALPARPGVRPLSSSQLRAALKDPDVSGESVRAEEDPYEQPYVEEVAIDEPRLVLQGLTNHSAHTIRMLLDAIFGPAGDGLPDDYTRRARLLAQAVLTLSHTVCSRAGLRRGTGTTQVQRRELLVPSRDRLAELRAAVTFTADDLASLLPADALQALDDMTTDAGAHQLRLGAGGDDGLIVRPLLRQGTDLIVINPSELAAALRHHLILLAGVHHCDAMLAEAFRLTALTLATELLTLIQALPRDAPMPGTDPRVLCQDFDAASGTIDRVGVLTDGMAGYDPADPFGMSDIENLGKPLQDSLDPPGDPDENDDRTLRLAMTDDIARGAVMGLRPSRRPGPFLHVPLDELQVMIDLDADDPLFLWQFARASERYHATTVVQQSSVLDTYAIYRDSDYSFYLSDHEPVTVASIMPGSGARLRAEAQARHDRHHIPGPEGHPFVEVLSLYGTDTAPIYYAHPRHGLRALAVELPQVTAWVLNETESIPQVREFLFSLLEAVTYWIWQLGKTDPGLLPGAADPAGQLQVIVMADDPARWSRILSGSEPGPDAGGDDGAPPSGPWVAVTAGPAGQVEVTALADHAGALLSGTNLADRQLVTALARAIGPPDASPTLVEGITERVAPDGPKQMIYIVRSSDVLLTPADVQVRTVQPAVTAVILDDLGQWLAGKGLSTGEVEPGKRTAVLGQAVEYYFERLKKTVAELSPEGLMAFLVSQDEALLQEGATREQRLPSRLACFGVDGVHAHDLLTEERKTIDAAVASRFLIEYAAATPPAGNRVIDLLIYDELLALSAELISRGILSDAIRFGFSQVQLSMLPSGRLGVSRGDRYSAGTEALAMTETEARLALALGPEPVTDIVHDVAGETAPTPTAPMRSQVDEAMTAEFGFTLTQAVDGLRELAIVTDAGPGLRVRESGHVRAQLTDRLGWDPAVVEAFLDRLTLRPRAEFMSPGPDVYPWRYNRDLSYIRRPLIEVTGPAGELVLMWGARRAWSAARYWTEVVYTGRLKADARAMVKLMGSIRQDQNRAFERQVAADLHQSGMPITASGAKKIEGRRLLSRDGDDLGDIDAIALDPASKLIIVAEAKDFELARTPAELANERKDLLTGDKSAAYKLGRRADWIRNHLAVTLRHFNAGTDNGGWRVLPVIITSRNLLSPRVIPGDTPVLTLADLPAWVSKQKLQRKRKRR